MSKIKISKKTFSGVAPLVLATIAFASGVEVAPASSIVESTAEAVPMSPDSVSSKEVVPTLPNKNGPEETTPVSPDHVPPKEVVPTLPDKNGPEMKLQRRDKRFWGETCETHRLVGMAIGGIPGIFTGPAGPFVIGAGMIAGGRAAERWTC
ncbi:hypothetical protein [Pasteuria penetrans]|uniref:hypothetical protein n=1 Tax=Pasteuria penetrans TaxID=86005 RepID=UPI000FB9438D|nr:hypothetical protein [Pasteuria penetrans]